MNRVSSARGATLRRFGEAVRDHEPLTIAEWDSLIASEQMATAEPFEGRS